MRIVSGKYRGKILKPPLDASIRPTTDKVKQALFTKLQFQIEGSSVLDLFCGSGALGVEAISRGATRVVFVDASKKNLEIAKTNVKSINEKAEFLCCDFEKALLYLSGKFDIIFLDPPYESGYYEKALALIHENNLLSPDGVIVCEHNKEEKISNQSFKIFDEKKYGTIFLTYFCY